MDKKEFIRVYEDEESITIWTYNLNITTHGPISVDIKHKKDVLKLKQEKDGKKNKNTKRRDVISN
jgi:hypothetical protein